MSLAVIQMVSQSDVLANLAQARRLLEQAAASGAKLAVLPENFAAIGRRDLPQLGRAEALGEGPILPWLRQAARDLIGTELGIEHAGNISNVKLKELIDAKLAE